MESKPENHGDNSTKTQEPPPAVSQPSEYEAAQTQFFLAATQLMSKLSMVCDMQIELINDTVKRTECLTSLDKRLTSLETERIPQLYEHVTTTVNDAILCTDVKAKIKRGDSDDEPTNARSSRSDIDTDSDTPLHSNNDSDSESDSESDSRSRKKKKKKAKRKVTKTKKKKKKSRH